MTDYITPARIAAVLTALSPFIANAFGEVSKQPVLVQCVIYAGLFLTGITFIFSYSRYVTQKKVVETQVNASK